MKRLALIWVAAVAFAAAPANASVIFSDNFNRADGALGSSWTNTGAPFALPATQISGNKACHSDHGFDRFVHSVSATHVKVSFDFTYSASDNELYTTLATGGGTMYVAGCENGGGGTVCQPRIGEVGGSSVNGTAITLTAGTTYGMTVEITGTNIDLTISDSGGTPLRTLSSNPGLTFVQYGFLAGRTSDANLTCIDDFLLEDLDDSALFTDDFNRAGPGLGTDWTGAGGPELMIAANRACHTDTGTGNAVELWNADISPLASVTVNAEITATTTDVEAGLIVAVLPTRFILTSVNEDAGSNYLRIASGVPGSSPDTICGTSSAFTFVPGTIYSMHVEIDPDGAAQATLTDGSLVNVSVTCNAGAVAYTKVVLLAEVGTGETACIDNFQLYALAPIVATCTDGIQNGGETGIDCGGSCPACPVTTATQTPTQTATSTPTSTPIPTPPPCVTPLSGCKTATSGKAKLSVSKKTGDTSKSKLAWSWKGQATDIGDLGTPATSTSYRVCIYNSSNTPIFNLPIAAGGTCGTKECWKTGSKGITYKNKATTAAGVSAFSAKAGADGKASLKVAAKGVNLSVPTLPLSAPVTAQVSNGTDCWTATFSTATSDPASTTSWKAKND